MSKNSPTPDAREALANIPFEVRRIHTRVIALRELVTQKEREIIFLAQHQYNPGEDPGHVENSKGSVLLLGQGLGATLTGLRTTLEVLEASAECVEASKTVEPLLAAVKELEAAELAQRIEADKKRHELKEALATAERAAQNAPAVVKAREALAALE